MSSQLGAIIRDGRKDVETRRNISLFYPLPSHAYFPLSPEENFPRNQIPLEFSIFLVGPCRPRETSLSFFICHLFLPESNTLLELSSWNSLNCKTKSSAIVAHIFYSKKIFYQSSKVQQNISSKSFQFNHMDKLSIFFFICMQLKFSPSLSHCIHYTRELLFSFLTGNHTAMMVKFGASSRNNQCFQSISILVGL